MLGDRILFVGNHYQALKRTALRCRRGSGLSCKENSEPGVEFQFDERFLQILWNEQRFNGNLKTTDGRDLLVVFPGVWNVSAGPDFRGAVLEIDGTSVIGDVEIHRTRGDWGRHGHSENPDYAGVVLHVFWQDDLPGTDPPAASLLLQDYVSDPLRELMSELAVNEYSYARKLSPGACSMAWAFSDDESLSRLLRVAGLTRLEAKALRLQRRSLLAGANQAVYEALFEALGYRANREAFRQLAQETPIADLAKFASRSAVEAVLFGRAGLLPDPTLVRVSTFWNGRIQELWDIWWRTGLSTLTLPWRRSGLRPLNAPERRLAAGIELLYRAEFDIAGRVSELAADLSEPVDLIRQLNALLTLNSEWENSRTFADTLPHPTALIGRDRRNDIVVNVFLPFLVAEATRMRRPLLAERARNAYLCVPRLQENHLIREAAHRFLVPPSRLQDIVRSACEQQGLLEIYRSFCGVLNCDCEICPFVAPPPVDQIPPQEYSVGNF